MLVSVRGKVYDLSASSLWAGGEHMHTHRAGRDLSLALLAAPHGADVLDRFQVVGDLAVPSSADAAPSVLPRPTGLAAKILALHPHAVSVHFPIALGIVAPLFLAASLALDKRILEQAALLDLVVAVLFVPPAILAGLWSWRSNYGGIWTPLFFRKAALASLLLCLSVGALVIRLGVIGLHGATTGPWWQGYVGLVLIHVPVLLGLGYLGGKLTCPR